MVSDYEWGYTGSQSEYSQTVIATEEGATPTDGVTSASIVNFLNNHPAPNKTWTWVREQLPYSQGETQAATTLFDIMDPNIQLGHGTIMSLITDDGGEDVWGEPYGLIGWNTASQHFVAGDGVVLRSDKTAIVACTLIPTKPPGMVLLVLDNIQLMQRIWCTSWAWTQVTWCTDTIGTF